MIQEQQTGKKIKVRWTFSKNQQEQIIEHLSSFDQIINKCRSFLPQKQQNIEDFAFIKKGNTYYKISENRITEQIDRLNENNNDSQPDIQIEFFFGPDAQKQKKLSQELKKEIRRINTQFYKLGKCMGQGYYNNLRMYYKKLQNQRDDIVNIKVYLLVSQPLVKRNENPPHIQQVCQEYNQDYIGIPKQQIKLNQHIQAIKQAHQDKNSAVNLFIQKVYVSWSKIEALVKRIKNPQRQEEKSIHLNIFQIYTQLFEDENNYHISLEDEDIIGLEDRSKTLNSLIKKLNEIGKKLYCIVLIGPKMRRLGNHQGKIKSGNMKIKQEWSKQTKVPIVVVSVFDPQKDPLLKKYFLTNFYTNIFKRETVLNCLKQVINKLPNPKNIDEKKNLLLDCLCTNSTKNQNWIKIIDRIGRSTAHRIFMHAPTTDHKSSLSVGCQNQIYKYIIGEKNNSLSLMDIKENEGKRLICQRVNFEHKRNQPDFSDLLIFNKDIETEFQKSRNVKTFWHAGQFKEEEVIKPSKNLRQRLLTVFQIVQEIQNFINNFRVLIITGCPKSGKSLFSELSVNYLMNRCQDLQFLKLNDWYKLYQQSYQKKILQKIKQNKKGKKLILLFNKVGFDKIESFQELINKLLKVEKDIFILASMGDSQKIRRNSLVRTYKIKKMKLPFIKYLILKHQQTSFNSQQDVKRYNQFIEQQLKNQNNFEIYYSYLFNDLKQLKAKPKLNQLESQNEYKIKRQEIAKKYKNKTEVLLNSIQQENQQLWQTIGFVCCFYEDFYICQFNKNLVFTKKSLIQDLIRRKETIDSDNSKIRLFRINFFENAQNNYKVQNSYLVHCQSKCFQYFTKHLDKFFSRKCQYFFQFYWLFYTFLKKNSGTRITEHCQRVVDDLGIFMFDFDSMLKQKEKNNETTQIKQSPENELKKMSYEQRSYLLERNLYIFIQFLREINDKHQRKLLKVDKQLLDVSYTVLLASICQRSENELFYHTKDELNVQINKFMKIGQGLMDSTLGDQQILILFYQISALTGCQVEFKANDTETNRIIGLLDNLLVYEKVKIDIEKSKRMIQLNSENKQKQIQRIIGEIHRAETAVNANLKDQRLTDHQKQSHYECLLDLVVEKILIDFRQISVLKKGVQSLNLSQLNEQFINYTKIVSQKGRNYSIIKLCDIYLKQRVQNNPIKGVNQKSFQYIPEKAIQLFEYLKQKSNQNKNKNKFSSTNITLFMKADYNFVRMDNIINKFLIETMSSKNLNLLFLNLSNKNFQMLSEQEPEILYFVLSVDCYEDKFKNLQVILEGNESLQAEEMKKEDFIKLIKKIKFKFLILFGSKSAQLATEIENKLHQEKKDRPFVIISLTLNNKHFDLSTYPFIEEEETPDVAKTAESFIKVEYSQRAMQMTICCIIYLLIKERHIKQVTKQELLQIAEKSINISCRVVNEWCKRSLCKLAPKITSKLHFRQGLKMEFPQIGEGKMKNISSDMTAIPKNFKDDKYYQNIGHTSILEEIFKKLSSNKVGTIIEISGGHNSGKTEILKEIGWLCFTRRIFELGVFRFDVAEMTKQGILYQIKSVVMNEKISDNKAFLILLDNIKNTQKNNLLNQIIQNQWPVSIVYTLIHQDSKSQTIQIKKIKPLVQNGRKIHQFCIDTLISNFIDFQLHDLLRQLKKETQTKNKFFFPFMIK